MTMVGALALVLGSLVAPSAGAEPKSRHQLQEQANEFIDECFLAGGEPILLVDDDSIQVICDFPTGKDAWCTFDTVYQGCFWFVDRPFLGEFDEGLDGSVLDPGTSTGGPRPGFLPTLQPEVRQP
jgi:hypothetical protein